VRNEVEEMVMGGDATATIRRVGNRSGDAPRSLLRGMTSTGPDGDPDHDGRFLSRAACEALSKRIFAMGAGGGLTRLNIDSRWTGNIRWARNDIATGGDTQSSRLSIDRVIRGASGGAYTNALTDDALLACVRRAEAVSALRNQSPDDYPDAPRPVHPHTQPQLWFDGTVHVDDVAMTAVADRVITPAEAAQVSTAGYLQFDANGYSVVHSDQLFRYYPFTTVQCSITVRDPKNQASGWAGVDWNDWTRVNAEQLVHTALDKCLRSRNPVAVEPGRYTAILEPQAVCDLVAPLMEMLDREAAEQGRGPFADPLRYGYSRIGQRVVDPRITLGADPMDPDCGFVPFDWGGEPYRAVNWIENGVLKELAYTRGYGVQQLSKDVALPNSRAFRISGGTTSIDDMIAGTTRGLLVTRFNNNQILDMQTMLGTGTTRDGLWLIERGKITKPVKNFRFTESCLFVMNNVEQLGAPQRVYHPWYPAVVPPMMVRDFSFTALVDAV